MATLSHSDSRRLYSWWWDSHISPKNSKWLQENLSDMDINVKAMIKVIEEDADSFARRAEMYYKKRPELMKLVEEFYRAYRALAERYDHATGALRQAHHTMAEAFPNQIPLALSDDSPSGSSATAVDPHTPEMPTPIHALFEPEDLHKDALGLSSQQHAIKRNRTYTEESDALESKKGLKQLNEMFASEEKEAHGMFPEARVRKGLNFHDEEGNGAEHKTSNRSRYLQKHEMREKEDADRTNSLQEVSQLSIENRNIKAQLKLESERATKAETEVQRLQEALSKSELQKEAVLLQYKQSLKMTSNLETEISRPLENFRKVNDEMLISVNRLRSVEERCLLLEKENKSLRLKLGVVEQKTNEQHQELHQKNDQLEKLKSSIHDERMRSAQAEVSLRSLEKLHAQSQEQLRLSALEVESKVETLKDMELQKEVFGGKFCQVKEENDHLKKELMQKLEELEKLNISTQDESVRSIQAEAALQSLEKKYSQSQEDMWVLALDVQSKVDLLKDMEFRKQNLEDEVWRLKKESESQNEKNIFSARMIKNLQDQNFSLKETQEKLKNEVAIHVNENKVLQLELCCLKEEINYLDRTHQAVMEEIEAVGLNAQSFQASIKELQNENLELKDNCKKHEDEKVLVSGKLEIMEKISERNTVLENSLSDAIVELERLREKMKALEESFETLKCNYSALTSEKGVLVLQIETIAENMEKLSDNNTFLENSLSDANAELVGLREKLKILEESHQSLFVEKSNLLTKKSALVSQVQRIRESLVGLEKRYAELEGKHSYLKSEKESALHQVSELKNLLKLINQEHESIILESKTQLASLKEQIIVLQEKDQYREEEFKQEQYKLLDAYIETFIFQRCLCDLNERNLSLVSERQKYLESSRWAERLITDLKQENLLQYQKSQIISENNEKLRERINLLLKTLHIPKNHGISDGTDDGKHWQLILHKIKQIQNSISEVQDENHDLLLQRVVNITLLQQLGLDVADLMSAKKTIEQELVTRNEELAMLQSEKNELLEMNGRLREDMQAANQREQVLKAEMVRLGTQLSELQEIYQMSQTENFKVLEENPSLLKEISTLREEKGILEEDKDAILMEAMALHCLSLILEQSNAERAMYLKMSSDDIYSLRAANNDLGKKVREMVEKVGVKELENLGLKESTKLEECRCHSMILEDNLNEARKHSEELNWQIRQFNQQLETGKQMLIQKEMELSEANQKFHDIRIQNFKLRRDIEDIKMELDEAKIVREELEKKLLILSEDVAHKDNEITCAQDSNKNLGLELCRLRKQNEELSIREKQLTSEASNKVKCYEEEVATLHDDLQTSIVHSVVFEENFLELIGACEGLEINSIVQRKMLGEEITSRNTYINELNRKLNGLEEENSGLKSKLNGYLPLVMSLCTSISHLEDGTFSLTKCFVSKNQEIQDDLLLRLDENCQGLSKDHSSPMPDGILELQKLQAKIDALQKLLVESGRLMMQEYFDAKAKLEAAMKEIEVVKSKRTSGQDKIQMMKDIQLDHVSDASCEFGVGSNQKSRIKNTETDDQMLELWETAERNCNSQLQKVPPIVTEDNVEYHQIEALEEEKSEYPSSELLPEKELGIDKIEVTTKDGESHEEWNERLLERLASDAERLSVLQTSVQELTMKMEKSEKSNHPASFEFDGKKGQLKEAEEVILQLVDINRKLTKKAKNFSASSDRKAKELEEMSNQQKRQVLERARRGSERIGRLELELQKIQYFLLKLQEVREDQQIKATERGSNVLLKDYLQGRREGYRRKKAKFCGCIRPKTKDD